MSKIRIAIVGVGNCASALIQGIEYYRKNPDQITGLAYPDIYKWKPSGIKVSAAFDIDSRKTGKDISKAIFAPPNCTTQFCPKVPVSGVKVHMGRVLDGVSGHMRDYPEERTFLVADEPEASREDIIEILQNSGSEILLNFLPVGSEQASRFYAECALEAGVAFINCIPVFIASDPDLAKRFKKKGLPVIGDDIKAQMGATIIHRALASLFQSRGVQLEHTYQLNTGGNTDFLNMLNRQRLSSKKASKTGAVKSVLWKVLNEENIHIGPSDYVPWQKDNKVSFIRLEGQLFGNVPMNLELRLSVEDSPNSAGVVIDAIRCCKLALDRGDGGALVEPSAYFMKHPPVQMPDEKARDDLEDYILE